MDRVRLIAFLTIAATSLSLAPSADAAWNGSSRVQRTDAAYAALPLFVVNESSGSSAGLKDLLGYPVFATPANAEANRTAMSLHVNGCWKVSFAKQGGPAVSPEDIKQAEPLLPRVFDSSSVESQAGVLPGWLFSAIGGELRFARDWKCEIVEGFSLRPGFVADRAAFDALRLAHMKSMEGLHVPDGTRVYIPNEVRRVRVSINWKAGLSTSRTNELKSSIKDALGTDASVGIEYDTVYELIEVSGDATGWFLTSDSPQNLVLTSAANR